MGALRMLVDLQDRLFGALGRVGDDLVGLAARLVFASVLLVYFITSGLTKIGPGPLGFLHPAPGAYAQVVPWAFEAAGLNPAAVAYWPWGVMVQAGTIAEFALPVLIVAGLFTRAAALGMMAFVAVQTFVDIRFHGADAETIGGFFDKDAGALIADQRLLWGFLLLTLVLKGPGLLSLDRLIGSRGAR